MFIPHLRNDTLVNLKNFKFVMNNESICMPSTTSTNTSIVIMIHTARSNFDHRYAIRNTWGSVKMLHQWTLHLIFLLGIDSDAHAGNYSETDTRLSEESNEHGDLIMGNFVDSYRNLSYKHLMGYRANVSSNFSIFISNFVIDTNGLARSVLLHNSS